MNIFEQFTNKYTTRTITSMKEYKMVSLKLIKTEERKNFLIESRRRGIFPRFIQDKTTVFNTLYTQTHNHDHQLNKLCITFMKNFLNMEI